MSAQLYQLHPPTSVQLSTLYSTTHCIHRVIVVSGLHICSGQLATLYLLSSAQVATLYRQCLFSTLSSASLSTQSSASLSTLSGPVVFDYVIVDSFVFDLSLSTLSSSTLSSSTQSSSTPPSHSPVITTWELSTYSEQSQLKHHSTATPILISYGHINNGSNLLHISSVDHIAPAPFECLGFNTPYKYLSKGNLIGVDLTPAKGVLTLRWYQLPPPRYIGIESPTSGRQAISLTH